MSLSYEERKEIYSQYFSLGYLNTDIGSKFALISLICYLTHKMQLKKPDVTCYKVIMKIIDKESYKHDLDFITNLSIICDDFMRNTSEFLTFDIKSGKEMAKKIREILGTYVPF